MLTVLTLALHTGVKFRSETLLKWKEICQTLTGFAAVFCSNEPS